jgi:hypothetical protein
VALGFPLSQLVFEGQRIGGFLEVWFEIRNVLAWFLLSAPFLLLGATATWLAMKVLGKGKS